ncbi:MAG: hypothetical protein CM1200mP2_07000 [Planctomycetaceae bacterium]|nr:MAG: hypothetical protein CM1200mP2_07000 [Planctomycetaceae bacterium]
MPDLSQMQIKVGIHEEMIERITEGFRPPSSSRT